MLSGASGSQPFCNGLNCSQLCCACAVRTHSANPNRPCAALCGYQARRGKRGAWHCLHAIPPTTYDDAVAQHRSARARPWARHPRDLSSGDRRSRPPLASGAALSSAAAPSAPGLGSPLSHICAGNGQWLAGCGGHCLTDGSEGMVDGKALLAGWDIVTPGAQFRCGCGRGEPSPGVDVAGVSESSPGADVAGRRWVGTACG
jgi:hypothetical protein